MAVPVKPFGVAKRRLSPLLGAADRSRLGKAVALHTLDVARELVEQVAVVTPDREVAGWAEAQGAEVIIEETSGLDGAARASLRAAGSRGLGWVILHADLPLLRQADLNALLQAASARGAALAPSRDGGTNALAGFWDDFPFAYGPGSFARHLGRAARRLSSPPGVVVRIGSALDLDGPSDLRLVREHPLGRWIEEVLAWPYR